MSAIDAISLIQNGVHMVKSADLTLGMGNDEYSFPETAGEPGQMLMLDSNNDLIWVNGGGSSGVNNISSSNTNISLNSNTGNVTMTLNNDLEINSVTCSGSVTSGSLVLPTVLGSNGTVLGVNNGNLEFINNGSGIISNTDGNLSITGDVINFSDNITINKNLVVNNDFANTIIIGKNNTDVTLDIPGMQLLSIGNNSLNAYTPSINNNIINIGHNSSQYCNDNSDYNIVIGNNSLNNSNNVTPTNTIILGDNSGSGLSNGNTNIVIGNDSANSNINSTNVTGNIIIGSHSFKTSNAGDNTGNIIIGNGTELENSSDDNSLVISGNITKMTIGSVMYGNSVDGVYVPAITVNTLSYPGTIGSEGTVLGVNNGNLEFISNGSGTISNTDGNLSIVGDVINFSDDINLQGSLITNNNLGYGVVSIGYGSCDLITTGQSQKLISIGYNSLALLENGVGLNNLNIGYNSSSMLTTGNNNCVVGNGSFNNSYSNGSNVVIFGSGSGLSNSAGYDNIIVGNDTFNTNATSNTSSLNTNIVLGNHSFKINNETNSGNIIIGHNTELLNSSDDNSLVIDGNITKMSIGNIISGNASQISIPNMRNIWNEQPTNNGQALTSDTSGNLSWTDVMTSGVTSINNSFVNYVDNTNPSVPVMNKIDLYSLQPQLSGAEVFIGYNNSGSTILSSYCVMQNLNDPIYPDKISIQTYDGTGPIIGFNNGANISTGNTGTIYKVGVSTCYIFDASSNPTGTLIYCNNNGQITVTPQPTGPVGVYVDVGIGNNALIRFDPINYRSWISNYSSYNTPIQMYKQDTPDPGGYITIFCTFIKTDNKISITFNFDALGIIQGDDTYYYQGTLPTDYYAGTPVTVINVPLYTCNSDGTLTAPGTLYTACFKITGTTITLYIMQTLTGVPTQMTLSTYYVFNPVFYYYGMNTVSSPGEFTATYVYQ